MNRIYISILISMLLILQLACTQDQKNKQRINSYDRRIVSLAPSITKQLLLLGVQDDIVGNTSYGPSDSLENSTIIASATEVNIEKIATLKPSIILCSSLTKKRTVDAMKKIDLNVRYLPVPKSFNDICRQFIEIGTLIHKKDKAKCIIKQARHKVDSLQSIVPDTANPKIFIEIGANPLFAATQKSFMHDYISFANGTNIAAGLKSGTISRESVLKRNPDVIIIVTMGIVGKEEKNLWQDYPNLNAAKKDNIFIVNADKASSPTPVSFTEVLETIINLIYKTNKHAA